MDAESKPNEIRIIRLYDASVRTVWDAWTDPVQVAKWWGPRGFTLTTHSKELKPGGIWHYTMHGPDGTDYENKTLYLEVETQKKLVYDHGGNDERAPLFRVSVHFSESDGKTKMEMRMALPTPEAAAEAKKFIKKAGGDSTWDRLAEYLEKGSTGKESFVINRTFDAPLELMYEMWSNPDHLSKWLAPTGFEMKFLQGEIKAGSSTFYLMTDNKELSFYGRATYRKLERPGPLQYTQQFCDSKNEKATRHPLAPLWTETMLTTVTLTAEGPDRTRITVIWEPHGAVSKEELDAFIKAKAGMTQGWTGSFDKLETLLAAPR